MSAEEDFESNPEEELWFKYLEGIKKRSHRLKFGDARSERAFDTRFHNTLNIVRDRLLIEEAGSVDSINEYPDLSPERFRRISKMIYYFATTNLPANLRTAENLGFFITAEDKKALRDIYKGYRVKNSPFDWRTILNQISVESFYRLGFIVSAYLDVNRKAAGDFVQALSDYDV